ncbi:MAG: dTMP kinase [Chloroflexota bacterium]|nr:dTMP kinase [Chloroflexota bacterium]
MNGKLIVFEGPDGVGKTSIVESIIESSTFSDWKVFSFPGQEEHSLGKKIYEIHHNPQDLDIDSIDPESLQILHIAAHVDIIKSRIIPMLDNGLNIILDRYWWSTWVYGIHYGVDQKQIEKILQIELYYWEKYLPNILFLINRDTPLKDEIELENWHKLQSLYLNLYSLEGSKYPIEIVNNNTDLTKTIQIIQGKLLKYIF